MTVYLHARSSHSANMGESGAMAQARRKNCSRMAVEDHQWELGKYCNLPHSERSEFC